jgi:hypothetical protein
MDQYLLTTTHTYETTYQATPIRHAGSLITTFLLRLQFYLYMDLNNGFSHQGHAETYNTSPFKKLKREANANKVTKIFKPSIIFPFLWGYDRTV